jgi:high-affinity nickel permease
MVSCFRIGASRGYLCTLKYNLGFHTRCGISLLSLANISLSSSTSLHDVGIVPFHFAVSCVATPVS